MKVFHIVLTNYLKIYTWREVIRLRVGIMGGTLDPVHVGHMQIAETALRELGLDRIMLLPAGDPPHKVHPTDKQDRWRMVQLAADAVPGVFACSIEIFRSGTTYTVDTLRELRAANPHTEWYYLIGADTLNVLDSWRCFDRVAKMCTFVVAGRGDMPAREDRIAELAQRYGARFEVLSAAGPEISSSDIRSRAAAGQSIQGLVPDAVSNYIDERGLYLCPYTTEEIKNMLKSRLKPNRYIHTIGVAETAYRLAAQCGVSPFRAYLAGLLHDCAKYMAVDEMRRMILQSGIETDAAELVAESVLHAPAGALIAADVYGIRDQEILSAIRKHTIGDGDMSPLEALIYTADFIEPNRKDFPGLSDVRTLADRDIYAAMRACARLTREYVIECGAEPHPKTEKLIQNDQSPILKGRIIK